MPFLISLTQYLGLAQQIAGFVNGAIEAVKAGRVKVTSDGTPQGVEATPEDLEEAYERVKDNAEDVSGDYVEDIVRDFIERNTGDGTGTR